MKKESPHLKEDKAEKKGAKKKVYIRAGRKIKVSLLKQSFSPCCIKNKDRAIVREQEKKIAY